MASASSSESRQSSTQQQVATQGNNNLTLGAGSSLSIGADAPGVSAGGRRRQDQSSTASAAPGSVTSNSFSIVTSDVNAIDLASHVAELNSLIAAGAITTVAHNASDLVNSTLGANLAALAGANNLSAAAIASNAETTRLVLASNNQILNTAANVIGTSESENSRLAAQTISVVDRTAARESSLYQQGLSFANSVVNQALTIAANATPQTAAAQAEIMAGSSPLSGTVDAAAPPPSNSNKTLILAGVVVLGLLAVAKFRK